MSTVPSGPGSDAEQLLLELRCTWWWSAGTVRLDAELVREWVERPGGGTRPVVRVDSRVLAAGTDVWPQGDDDDGDSEARAALEAGTLPADDEMAWGVRVGRWLEQAVPEEEIAALVERAQESAAGRTHVRFAFRALDARTAAIPVETVIWPPTLEGTQLVTAGVSVVRTADHLATGDAARCPPLGARDPGALRTEVRFADGAGRDTSFAERLEHGLRALRTAGDSGSLVRLDEGPQAGAERPDLVLICGHGSEHGIELDADATVLPDELPERLPATASIVLLAVCGAVDGTTGRLRPSLALELARSGRAVVLGFQGAEARLEHVQPCVLELTERLAPAVRAERRDSPLELRDWERALAAARARIAAPTQPVLFVHPGALAGRASPPEVGRTTPRRPDEALAWSAAPRPVLATPWYVPGQVAWLEDGGDLLRLPLPVDVGTRIEVSVVPGGDPSILGTMTLTPEDLQALATAWGMEDEGIALQLHPGRWGAPIERTIASWARRSAELSAVMRALIALRGVPAARAKLQGWLAREVAADGGTPDAAPRLVAVDAGRSGQAPGQTVQRKPHWPDVAVQVPETPVRADRRPDALLDRLGVDPRALAIPGVTAATLLDACASADALLRLLSRQRDRADEAGRSAFPANVRLALQSASAAAPSVAFPSVALVVGAGGSTRGLVRALGAEPTAVGVTVDDELEW